MNTATAQAQAPARELVPANAESATKAIRRVRLAKALAATAKGRVPGLVGPPKSEGTTAGRGKKPKSGTRRCKLDAEDHVRLAALKRRLELLGRRIKRGELIGAGLLALAAMNDEQLQEAVAMVASVGPAGPERLAA